MYNRLRVLVTGAGSGVGQGIVKSLRNSRVEVTIISADIVPLNASLYRADEAVFIPKVESHGALSIMTRIIKENKIDIVMVGSEFDLCFFAENKSRIEEETGALIVASPLKTVEIAGDKWLTSEFLRENGLPYAESYLAGDINDAVKKAAKLDYPFVLKDRFGTSSRNVYVLNNEDALINIFEKIPNPVLQKYIGKSQLSNEYTCSIFKCANGSLLGPFTARRTLRGGSSWVIEVDQYKELYPLLLSIGEKLPIMGSLNIQLMINEYGAIPFEFNARFSGTTAVRAYFGFNEPEMVIRNYYLKEEIDQTVIRNGLAMRYLEEVFIDGLTVKDLDNSFPKGAVKQWF